MFGLNDELLCFAVGQFYDHPSGLARGHLGLQALLSCGGMTVCSAIHVAPVSPCRGDDFFLVDQP